MDENLKSYFDMIFEVLAANGMHDPLCASVERRVDCLVMHRNRTCNCFVRRYNANSKHNRPPATISTTAV